eukprot:m.151197 g.151197  ORF g.151197 m.151197 type:complete len:139 (-) comp13291_c5_seq2:2687-3103(-)
MKFCLLSSFTAKKSNVHLLRNIQVWFQLHKIFFCNQVGTLDNFSEKFLSGLLQSLVKIVCKKPTMRHCTVGHALPILLKTNNEVKQIIDHKTKQKKAMASQHYSHTHTHTHDTTDVSVCSSDPFVKYVRFSMVENSET